MAVLEIARFRLRDGATVGEFLAQNTRVELEHVSVQPGYRVGSRHTTVTDDGTWVITVGWESTADAEASMASFTSAPAIKDYMYLIEMSSMSMERMTEIPAPSSRRTANARSLYLDGIRDGNAREALDRYVGDRYTQHSTGVADGKEGFLAFFEPFLERNPVREIEVVRAIKDGPYVFCHVTQTLGGTTKWATADLFETDADDRIVEHWDTIAPGGTVGPSGHTQTDGATEVTDLDRTEANKQAVADFASAVLQGGDYGRVTEFISTNTYIQHNSQVADGLAGFGAFAAALAAEGKTMTCNKVVCPGFYGV